MKLRHVICRLFGKADEQEEKEEGFFQRHDGKLNLPRSEMTCYDIGMGRLLSESGVYLVCLNTVVLFTCH